MPTRNRTAWFQFYDPVGILQHIPINLFRNRIARFQFCNPIGILQPILINPKRPCQGICKQKLGWDKLLPDDFRNEFEKICFLYKICRKFPLLEMFYYKRIAN